MPQGFFDETKATARLPNLDVEIVRSRSPTGGCRTHYNQPASGAFLRGIWPFPGGHKSVSILDAHRSDGLDALAWRLRRKASNQELRSPAGYGGVCWA